MEQPLELIQRQPQRLFAFGCSYTQYAWATWPEIVAHDLSIPMYNAARAGAGNQYIANLVSQLNQKYQFDENDLVMISWSGFLREDRWIKNAWQVRGDSVGVPAVLNYPSSHLCNEFIDDFSDPIGYYVRDFATIALVKEMLRLCGCQYHMFSIYDIPFVHEHENSSTENDAHVLNKIVDLYGDVVKEILPSFDHTVWHGDQHAHKAPQMKERWDNKWTDWHPTIDEQFIFLERTFSEHQFSDYTKNTVEETFDRYSIFMRSLISRPELLCAESGKLNTIDLPEPEWTHFNEDFHLVQNNLDTNMFIW